ncbi:MAG: hypothetical protein SGILL_004616 [Bacillariaceae sp.]
MTGFPLAGETCTMLFAGVPNYSNSVRQLILLGTGGVPTTSKAVAYDLGNGSVPGSFNTEQTLVHDQEHFYAVDISFSRDYRSMELLEFAATASPSDFAYPPWFPFVKPPPVASALKLKQVHSKHFDNQVWEKTFTATHPTDPSRTVSVLPSGVYTNANTGTTYVVGSTTGTGEAFGAVDSDSAAEADMDGFIFKLDSMTGELDTTSSDPTRRIGTAGQDYIISQCSPAEEMALMDEDKFQNTDESLANILYVVGATSSTMYLPTRKYAQGDGITPIYRVFISKIDLDTLEAVWTTEMFAPAGSHGANATATQCVVDPATKDVYVSGISTTQLQAHVPSGQSGIKGNLDGADGGLWVTRMDDTGMIKWLKQFGSKNTGEQADRITDLTLVPGSGLSPGGAKDAARVLVSGHSNGNVAVAATSANTELFVAALDANSGDLLSTPPVPVTPPPTMPPPTNPPVPAPTPAPVPAPTDAPKPPTDAPVMPPTNPPVPAPTPPPVPAPTDAPQPTDAPIMPTPPPVPSPTDAPQPTDAPIMPTQPPLATPTDPPETESPSASPSSSPTEMPDPHADASVTSRSFQSNWGPSYAGAMVMAHDQDYLWVGGMNEEQGTDRNSPQHGFFTLYQRDHKNPDWNIMSAKVVDAIPKTAKVQLPDAMVVNPQSHKVVMAMVTSNVDELTPEFYKFVEDDEDYPNLTAGAVFRKRGYGYYGTIQTFRIDEGEGGKIPVHDHDVVLQTDKDAFITGMRLIGQTVVIVGNLSGKHDKYFPTERDARDMDGFAILKNMDRTTLTKPLRLNSIEDSEDFVHNVCESPDGDSFFLVGSTMGTMANATTYGEHESSEDVSAYVSKILLGSMEVAWTTQFYPKKGSSSLEAHARAEAFGCHVIPHDSSVMYAGGVVYDGASMNKNLKSAGSDDM